MQRRSLQALSLLTVMARTSSPGLEVRQDQGDGIVVAGVAVDDQG
ncbi:hypothetical protein NT01EI_2933 [Edwardsiella ictaluri 93-146]|uniref:Uncharacterized protein n=1 Tax=Edwardsiella ictaluri (strain 93-146) TaxID=634503 RepID=C5BGC4_EDWI9|nr:hypothetical protein NT01EI_2933 [Edwardsiella ictaluri 93-146]